MDAGFLFDPTTYDDLSLTDDVQTGVLGGRVSWGHKKINT